MAASCLQVVLVHARMGRLSSIVMCLNVATQLYVSES